MIGKIIKDAREKASLSQGKLAKQAKISVSTLSRIESGERTPTKEMAKKIAKALAIPEEELFPYCNREKHAIGEGEWKYTPLRYLPIVEKLAKVRHENLPKIHQLLDEILENKALVVPNLKEKKRAATGEGKMGYIPLRNLPIVNKLAKVPDKFLPQIERLVTNQLLNETLQEETMKLEIKIERDNYSYLHGYLATANGCTGWNEDPRTAVAIAIMSALAEETPEVTINGQTVDLFHVVTGDLNVGAIAHEPQT